MAYIYDLTDTWNAGGTTFNAIKMNVTDSASAAGSKLVTLQTNGTEHFSVTKAGVGYFSGNVGIGTSNPFAKLEVNGGIRASVGSGGQLELYEANPTRANVLIAGADASGAFVDASYASGGSGALLLRTLGSERMRITSAGNVGIGTSSPNAVLAAQRATSAGNTAIDIINSAAANTSNKAIARFSTSSDYIGYEHLAPYIGGYMENSSNLASGLVMGTYTGGSLLERMRIDSSGNVGIGTSSPSAKLDVVTAGAFAAEFNGTNTYVDIVDSTVTGRLQAVGNTFYIGTTTAVKNVGFKTGAGVEAMLIDSAGRVGIGTGAPGAGLHIVNANLAGQFRLQDVTADATAKYGVIASGHYTNAEESFSLVMGVSSAASNTLYLGGAVSTLNAASTIAFYTAANNTTTTGSERMRIDSSGNMTVGSTGSFARLASVAADGTYQLALVGTSKAVRMRSDTTNFKIEAVDQTLSSSFEPLWLGGSLIQFGTSTTERLRIKSSGGIRYIPLASAPSSPEAGEVYYDSTTNKLRCYNGTTWNDLF